MGAAASSSGAHFSDREEKFFETMQEAYEKEYKPQVAENKLNKEQSIKFFTEKVNSFVESEPKAEEKRTPARPLIHKRASSIQPPPSFYVGDIVKAKVDGMMFEGVVVSNGNENVYHTVEVDFGDDVEEVQIDNCSLVMSGLDFEVNDLVQARTEDSVMYCNGKLLHINFDGTMDILFDGDDEEDVEKNIPVKYVRKLRTGRELAKRRWHRARTMISSIRAFSGT